MSISKPVGVGRRWGGNGMEEGLREGMEIEEIVFTREEKGRGRSPRTHPRKDQGLGITKVCLQIEGEMLLAGWSSRLI